jgi:hypothetical protein
MKDKHWIKVWELVEGKPQTLLNFTFDQLLKCGIDAHFDTVEAISAMAAGES